MNADKSSWCACISVICLGETFTFTISDHQELPLAYIASETLRQRWNLHKANKENCNVNHEMIKLPNLTSTSIHGLLTLDMKELSMSQIVTLDFCRKHSKLKLIFQGPMNNLPDQNLLKIGFLAGRFIKDFSILLRVNKRFHALFGSDQVWQYAKLQTPYLGRSLVGHDDEEWSAYRDTFGLPWFNTLRIRWISHHVSRLKIVYGAINDTNSINNDTVTCTLPKTNSFLCGANDDFSDIRAERMNPYVIPIIGVVKTINLQQSFAQLVIRQLYHLVPYSVAEYHLHRTFEEYPPLLKGAAIILPESPLRILRASVIGSGGGGGVSGRPPLGGIMRESFTAAGKRRLLRYVGDPRMTFAQFDHLYTYLPESPTDSEDLVSGYLQANVYNGRHEEVAATRDLFVKSKACIVAIDYIASDTIEFYQHLTSVIRTFILNPEERLINGSKPLLILIGLEEVYNTPLSAREIRVVVDEISEMVERILQEGMRGRGISSQRPWYVQPVSHTDLQDGEFRTGFVAGINWLMRALVTNDNKKRSLNLVK